jgi:hypothetical protein
MPIPRSIPILEFGIPWLVFNPPRMEAHEWHERTEEGVRYWRATHHSGKWFFQTTLKTDPDWSRLEPAPRAVWVELRDVLWRKYQRKRCPWIWIEEIDKLLEEDPEAEFLTQNPLHIGKKKGTGFDDRKPRV